MPNHKKTLLALRRELSELAEAEYGRDARVRQDEPALRYCARILMLMEDPSAAPGGTVQPGETIVRSLKSTRAVPTNRLSVVVHAARDFLTNLLVEDVERRQNAERAAWAKVLDAMTEALERSVEAGVGREGVKSEEGRAEFISQMRQVEAFVGLHFPKEERASSKTVDRTPEERARLTVRQLRLALAAAYSNAEIAGLVDDGIESDKFKAADRVRQERKAAQRHTKRHGGSDQEKLIDPNKGGREWVVMIP